MKAALIENGIVSNIIVWDETCVAPEGVSCVILPDDFPISIGWVFNGGESFTDPNPPVQSEPPAAPTLAELQAQLAALTASIQSLVGNS